MTIRVLHVGIQVALVEDNGTELTPGPESQVQYLTVENAKKFLDDLPAELLKLNAPKKPATKPATRRAPAKTRPVKKEARA